MRTGAKAGWRARQVAAAKTNQAAVVLGVVAVAAVVVVVVVLGGLCWRRMRVAKFFFSTSARSVGGPRGCRTGMRTATAGRARERSGARADAGAAPSPQSDLAASGFAAPAAGAEERHVDTRSADEAGRSLGPGTPVVVGAGDAGAGAGSTAFSGGEVLRSETDTDGAGEGSERAPPPVRLLERMLVAAARGCGGAAAAAVVADKRFCAGEGRSAAGWSRGWSDELARP